MAIVQSLIKRKAGSTVKLGDSVYVFNDANNHECEVKDKTHIAIFDENQSFNVVKEKPAKKPKEDLGGSGDEPIGN